MDGAMIARNVFTRRRGGAEKKTSLRVSAPPRENVSLPLAHDVGNFDKWLARDQQSQRVWQRGHEDSPEVHIRGVATPDPENLRWRPEPFQEENKVDILRQDNRARFARGFEDRRIRGVEQPKPSDTQRLDLELLRNPRRENGRQLSVDPDDHATSTG
jgi:hypothetical protein